MFTSIKLVFFLLLGALLTLSACSPGSAPKRVQAHLTPPCGASQAGVVLVYFHDPSTTSKDGSKCLERGALDANGDSQQQQVSPPISGVYRICATAEDAYVEDDSLDDPAPTVQSAAVAGDALGSIGIFMPAHTCETVLQAVGERRMEITGSWISPCFCGIGAPGSLPRMPIHQVGAGECSNRADFFTIIYDGGKQRACYANAGFLKLSHPLTGVVRVCSGNNTGDVSDFSDNRPETGINLRLGKMRACVAPGDLLHETEITVNQIAIDPAPSA